MRRIIFSISILALTLGDAHADLTREQSNKIAKAVGSLIGQIHYRRTRLNNEVSEYFLTDYLKTLDFTRMIFLQGDIDTITKRFSEKLDNRILAGDIAPAHVIFELYLTRLKERLDYIKGLVNEEFDFTKDDHFQPARQKLNWPKTKKQAEALWRARVKFELLADRLSTTAKPTAKAFDAKASFGKIARRYDRLLRNMKESDQEEILAFFLSSMTRAYDPHSDYMSAAEAANFRINMNLKLTGIGAVLQSDDGYTKIVRIMPGGPAARSGLLKANDKIIAVQNPGDKEPVDIIEMNLNKVVQLIRGKKDTIVKLTIIPANPGDGAEKKVISITRDVVRIADQMAKAYVIETPNKKDKGARLGVINLPGFYTNCARDVALLIKRLKKEKISGLIIDLRRNGGGILGEAVNLTGLFIKEGPVVQVKDSFGRKRIHKDTDARVVYEGPLVVAVSHMSASASEIVAGALQDYGRAVVVGDGQTHGKGTVQSVIGLNRTLAAGLGQDSGLLKFTIQKFYRVAGTTTQKIGVTPDIQLPSVLDHMDIGEGRLPRALESDEIDPAKFAKLNQVTPYTAKLRLQSKKRLKADPDYKYIAEDIHRLKKQQTDKTISLNEMTRRKENEANKARVESRKKERASRAKTGEKIFALDLNAVKANNPLKAIEPRLPNTNPDNGSTNSKPPDSLQMDASLRETLRILNDYRQLLSDSPAVSSK